MRAPIHAKTGLAPAELNSHISCMSKQTKTIPNDGEWHELPASHAEAPTLPFLQLDIADNGNVLVRNGGPAPVEVRYA